MKVSAKLIYDIAQNLDAGMKVYLNKDSLEMESIPDFDEDLDEEVWDELLEKVNNRWENVIILEKLESRDAFKIMERFAEELEDERFSNRLFTILSRKSPFANFEAEVENSEYRQQWFSFKQQEYEKYVRSMLELEGLEIVSGKFDPQQKNVLITETNAAGDTKKSKLMKIGIINGPNLNLLGKREPEIYGEQGFEDYLISLKEAFPAVNFRYMQSNVEGELVNALQEWDAECEGIIINPAGYSHTSVAVADAIRAIDTPVIEVHLSNVHRREPYRHTLITGAACVGIISGLGLDGYRLALDYFVNEG